MKTNKYSLVLMAFIGLGALISMRPHGDKKASVEAATAVTARVTLVKESAPVAGPTAESVKEVSAPSVQAAAVVAIPAIPKDEAPQAVLDWSTDLGRGMLGAFREPAQAEKMFSFLRVCAEDKSLGMAYRAVCAGNAKRLSDRFPDKFSQNFGGFQRGLPERIQEFLAQANTNF